MARLVKNTIKQNVYAERITTYKDDIQDIRYFQIDDEIEDLRYVQDEEIKLATGRISDIQFNATKTTVPNMKNFKDNLNTDASISNIIVDASEQYKSNLITIPAMEIVEDEGVLNVKKVDITIKPRVTMKMEYTDRSIVDQDLEVGDLLREFVAMSGTPRTDDVTGNFYIVGFKYTAVANKITLTGLYLQNEDGSGDTIAVDFKNIISFVETPLVEVSDTTSMSAIADALGNSENGEVVASLGVDVTVPYTEDGKVKALKIYENQKLDLDLNGHTLSGPGFALYVDGGELNISDSVGTGKIESTAAGKPYATVQVKDGVCNMNSGLIDTHNVEATEDKPNWLYGVACSGSGVFNMTGGTIHTYGAAGLTVTNGTASGAGAKFVISGDAKIISDTCASIYLADNKSVTLKDNVELFGGIVARMGDINIEGRAKVEAPTDESLIESLGMLATTSGVANMPAAITALTGVYKSDLGNDMNIKVANTANVISTLTNNTEIALINTKYDQKVNIDIADKNALEWPDGFAAVEVFTHDQLDQMATEAGAVLAPEKTTTDLTININGKTVYPE